MAQKHSYEDDPAEEKKAKEYSIHQFNAVMAGMEIGKTLPKEKRPAPGSPRGRRCAEIRRGAVMTPIDWITTFLGWADDRGINLVERPALGFDKVDGNLQFPASNLIISSGIDRFIEEFKMEYKDAIAADTPDNRPRAEDYTFKKTCDELFCVRTAVIFLLHRCKNLDDEVLHYGADNQAYQTLIDAIVKRKDLKIPFRTPAPSPQRG